MTNLDVLVEIRLLCANSSKTSFNLTVGAVHAWGHHTPQTDFISQFKG